jgi:hypothetical protein
MKVEKLIDFLNSVNLKTLGKSLDELDKKVEDIFSRTKSDLNPIIINEIKNRDEKFFVWFCFLRGNFLRGRDTISNKAFVQFIEFCRNQGNNLYFDRFPLNGNFLPRFYKPKFRRARQIEEVLQQLKGKYNSGCEFVEEIEKLTNHFEVEEVHKLYLNLIANFMRFKQIGSKIANAILGEVSWEISLLKKYNKKKIFQNFSEKELIKKLVLASCFNVMIDTHVKNFFEEKLNFKNVEHSHLLLIAKSINPETTRFLFERNFDWIKEKDFLLTNYKEYIGANMIEKLIWVAYFVKKNSRKKDDINNLQFFKLSGNIFL